jgi:hypothetical protein
MWLLIDDFRDLNVDVIAVDVSAGKRCLTAFAGEIECLLLDLDMGASGNGYDLAKWAVANGLMPNRVQLVTDNPVGRDNIAGCLVAAGWTKKSATEFIKE